MNEDSIRRFDYNLDERDPYLEMEGFELDQHTKTAKNLWDKSEHKVILLIGEHKVISLIGEHSVNKFVTKNLLDLYAIKVKISDVTRSGRTASVWLILFDDGDIEKLVIPFCILNIISTLQTQLVAR